MARESETQSLNPNPAAHDLAAGYLGGDIASTYLADAPLECVNLPVDTAFSFSGFCCYLGGQKN